VVLLLGSHAKDEVKRSHPDFLHGLEIGMRAGVRLTSTISRGWKWDLGMVLTGRWC
jgi:hypothetical protein